MKKFIWYKINKVNCEVNMEAFLILEKFTAVRFSERLKHDDCYEWFIPPIKTHVKIRNGLLVSEYGRTV